MSDFLTRVKFGVAGGLSIAIFAAAMFVGLSDTGPGPVKAFVGAILLIGYAVHRGVQEYLSRRQENVLTGGVFLLGFGAVAWGVFVNGAKVSQEDLIAWGGLVVAIVLIGGWTLLARRRPE
ncbi:hypothetical protein C453_00395 [Haloferax elongans ATCC BAA-1513]|uniref:Uncharacterized protein n=1 Tax=Haloferax elongans ATCC BAA-1513 TaxID=1230453 RepID=M0I282_HALEO|nr:hypothetical protein [Haloferax elongans]ELZ89489.1 hypothetical protein C453_00395 [Haloferax elongans ATCC BAA-1513]